MFGKAVTLFRILGFKVQVDGSWLFLAVLLTWYLGAGYFPFHYKDLPSRFYWLMGMAGALGLFASIIFHELCHSVVARKYGIPIKGITLFIFGGVAHMEEEPASPKAEFLMAIAGPISSYFLGGLFYGLWRVGEAFGMPVTISGVVGYLAVINGVLATFNLIPAFPLDGGRAFRATLWAWKGNIRWATRIASRFGSGFGIALIVLGFLNVFGGYVVTGMWWILIGFFLKTAASVSYVQLLHRRMLEGEPIRRFMTADPVTVPPNISVEELVEEYIYRYFHDMFPVTQDSRVLGCVTSRQIRDLPREEWAHRHVEDLLIPCSEQNTIQADTDAMKALVMMNRTGQSRLLVMEGERLVGVVALKDLLKFLTLKMDLEAPL